MPTYLDTNYYTVSRLRGSDGTLPISPRPWTLAGRDPILLVTANGTQSWGAVFQTINTTPVALAGVVRGAADGLWASVSNATPLLRWDVGAGVNSSAGAIQTGIMTISAVGAWTPTSQGTKLSIATTPEGSTVPSVALEVEDDGSISLLGGLRANSGLGAPGDVLTSNGSSVYWSSAAVGGSITVFPVTFDVSGGGAAGSAFNGSVALTVDHSTVGAPSVGGTGATGTWGISITGNANNATYAFGKTEGNLNVNSAATANNATYAFGKTEGSLNVNSAAVANNATYAFGKTEGSLNVNSAASATTANNATYAFGKTEGSLNVNSAASATTATTANNATYAFGKTEGNLNVNSAAVANNATYAFGKTEGSLNVNSAATATTANNATYAFGKTEGNLNVNSAATATTANNATYAFGKTEGNLNVNSAASAPASGLTGSTLAAGVTGSSLTSIGTIATGVWNGTPIGVPYGGTGLSSYTSGLLLVATGTTTLGQLALGSEGQVLTISGGALAWAAVSGGGSGTTTYPATFDGTAGDSPTVTFDGSVARTIGYATVGAAPAAGSVNIVTVGTIGTGTWQGTAVAVGYGGTGAATAAGARTNLGLVIGTDVPSPTGTGASGTWGISITGSAASVPASGLTGSTLAAGVTGSSLTSVGTIATGVWQGTAVAAGYGGTGTTSYATGDLLYATGASALGKLGIGTAGQVLTVSGGVPTWATPTLGTVTSVAMSVPIGLSVTGSPITSSGTLAVALVSGYMIPGGGSTGQVLQSQGGSAPTWSTTTYPATVTADQVLRGTSTNVVGGDASLTHNGTSLTVTSTGGAPQLRVAYDSDSLATFTVNSTGSLAVTANGNIDLSDYNTIYVKPGTNTLSDAVANMSNKDCLVLGAGAYTQTVSVTFPVGVTKAAIIGAGSPSTIITYTSDVHGIISQGMDTYGPLVTSISASTEAMTGTFTVENGNTTITHNTTTRLDAGKTVLINGVTLQINTLINSTAFTTRTAYAGTNGGYTGYHYDHLRMEELVLSGFTMYNTSGSISTKSAIFLMGHQYSININAGMSLRDIAILYNPYSWQYGIRIVSARKVYMTEITVRQSPNTAGRPNEFPYNLSRTLTGTSITTSTSSTTVTGSGTSFTTQVFPGDMLHVSGAGGDQYLRRVTGVSSDTALTVSHPFDEAVAATNINGTGTHAWTTRIGTGIQLESVLNCRLNKLWLMGCGVSLSCDQANELYVNDAFYAGCEDVCLEQSTCFYSAVSLHLGNKTGWFKANQVEFEFSELFSILDDYNYDPNTFRSWDTPSGGYHQISNSYLGVGTAYSLGSIILLRRPGSVITGNTMQPNDTNANGIRLDPAPGSPFNTNGLYVGATWCSVAHNLVRFMSGGTGILVLGNKNAIMGNIFQDTNAPSTDIIVGVSGVNPTYCTVVGNIVNSAVNTTNAGTGCQVSLNAEY